VELAEETPEDWWEVEALYDLCFAPGREALSSYRLRDGSEPIAGLCLTGREHGVLAAAIVLLPGIRVIGIETGQAFVTGAIGMHKGPTDVLDHTRGALWVTKGTVRIFRPGMELVSTFLVTNPTGTQALVVDAIEGQSIAVCAEWMTVVVIATYLAGCLVFVVLVATDSNHRNDAFIIKRVQALRITCSRIGDEFANEDLGQALAQESKVPGQDLAFVSNCRLHGRVSDPVGVQFVISEDLGIAAVAVNVTCARRVLLAVLVAASVVNQTSLGITCCCQATALRTDLLRTGASLESLLLCWTGTWLLGRCLLVARISDLTAEHRGMCFVQHAIGSDGKPSVGRRMGMGRMHWQQSSGRQVFNEPWAEIGIERDSECLVEGTHRGRTRWMVVSKTEQSSPALAFRSGQMLGQFLPAQTLLPAQ
jgi:hypothetical protein